MNYRKKRAGDGDVKKVQVYLQPTKNEERLEAIRKEKEKEENEVCTFKPKTNITDQQRSDPQQVSSGSRFEDLYRRVEKGTYKTN